jgi:uncharacterized protein (DUF427 family)
MPMRAGRERPGTPVGHHGVMSISKGPAPLSAAPAGQTNYRIDGPKHRLLFQAHPRRIRAELDGRTVLDTVRGRLLHESEILPRFYAPLEDFDEALLERTDHSTYCPFKGYASYFSLRVGDSLTGNAIWTYEDPLPEADWLKGFGSLYWGKADAWYEEDERVFGHLNDPYARVDIRRSSRRAVVSAGGEIVAESDNPTLLYETALPVRVYLRRDEVRADLRTSATTTICPYKGTASYWSLNGRQDAVWCYEDPLPEARTIAGLVSFLGEGIEVELEGAGMVVGA